MAYIPNLHYYQGVIVGEIALTLFFFVIFQIIYYAKWGYQHEKANPPGTNPNEAEPQSRITRWDQKTWDIYFPIIFGNHLVALALPLVYSPYVFTIIIAYLHFGWFLILMIVNIVLKEPEPGQGTKTIVSRVLWAFMCVFNITLIITGLTGTPYVLTGVVA